MSAPFLNPQFQLNESSRRHHRTKSKGDAAEIMAHAAFVMAGFIVSKPSTEHSAYDLVVDDGIALAKVQVKWARVEGDFLRLWTSTVNRKSNRSYTAADCDFFAAYSGELGTLYVLPYDVVGSRKAVQLRLDKPRNGQRAGVRWREISSSAEPCRAEQAIDRLTQKRALYRARTDDLSLTMAALYQLS